MSDTSTRRVLITGGTGVVGRALVASFSTAGYETTFSYFSNRSVAEELEREFDVRSVHLDLKNYESVILESSYDVLVNNAGVNISRVPVASVEQRFLRETLSINFLGAFKLCQLVLPAMCEAGWGRIINIGSIYSFRGSVANSPYVASKHALSGLTKAIAREYAHKGITSNEICPGAIESDLMYRIAAYVAEHEGGTREQYLDDVRNRAPSHRMTLPREVADLAVFLAGSKSDHVNGTAIVIDGAYTV
jgi:3-hydroxybutyrate dehydrogenase